MVASRTRWRPTLRFTIGTVICSLIALTGCVVLAITYYNSRKTLLDYSAQLIDQVAATTQEQVTGFLSPARAGADLTLKLVESGVIGSGDIKDIESYFFDFLQVNLTVAMLNYGDEQGNFLMVKRQPDGSLSTKTIRRTYGADGKEVGVTTLWQHRRPGAPLSEFQEQPQPEDRYDPRGRPWYVYWTGKDLEAPGQPPRYAAEKIVIHWTDVYVFHSDQKPGITASVPRLDAQGKLQGVLSVDIGLVDLSHFLAGLKIGKTGKAFILDQRQRLIAVPDIAGLIVMKAQPDGRERPALRAIAASSIPELATLAQEESFLDAYRGAGPKAKSRFNYRHQERQYLAILTPIKGEAGAGWLIGVVVAEDDFLGDIKRAMGFTILVIGGVMLLAFLLALGLSRIVARSLRQLVDESARIQNLDFSSPGAPDSVFKEVHEVLTAFEGMKGGLRSFERYVPSKLVRLLLAKRLEPRLGGEDRELSIFFSDIRNFTTISEAMDRRKLAEKLGDYLSVMTNRIQNDSSQGIVDKYMGDAIMAFWGAPEAVTDTPARACRAALACLAAVAELRRKDPEFPDFHTRIGIHTAMVVVGNFGSNERLNYTCIGDGVNLAARLEAINKHYGTQIIISEDTCQRVRDRFVVRRLDLVAVKGRSRGVCIYELLGETGGVEAGRLQAARRYEEAFSLYLERKWDEAGRVFQDVHAAQPDDTAATLLLGRCQEFKREPPPASWNGVHVMETK